MLKGFTRMIPRKGMATVIILMRISFGIGWLLAGVTKVTDKSWFAEPGVFLQQYLLESLGKSNVPLFYKWFIQHIALEQILLLNYAIPLAQISLGAMIIVGFLTIPSILICLFMHINFILSGNMNLISLILYTSAFGLLLSGNAMLKLSLDLHLPGKRVLRLFFRRHHSLTSPQSIQS